MRSARIIILTAIGLVTTAAVFTAGRTSGGIGYYGIIEKVVFEPSDAAPERIQVWGAFAYVDDATGATSPAKRGYLYFKNRSDIPGFTRDAEVTVTLREWNDLKSVAGTGQAVGFGHWGYIAGFGVLQPDRVAPLPSYLYERKPQGGERTDLRVRPATEVPTAPATYQTNNGVVKIPEAGSHADIVKQLKAALRSQTEQGTTQIWSALDGGPGL